MKKRFIFFALMVFIMGSWLFSPKAFSGGAADPAALTSENTRALKKDMSKFGSLLAGLEIIKLKEKKPDWDAINLTLQEMSSTLSEMQNADTNNVYKEYTDVLTSGLLDLKQKAQKRDQTIFDGIDQLSNTCFKCHAAHRPADIILPKKNQRISGEGK